MRGHYCTPMTTAYVCAHYICNSAVFSSFILALLNGVLKSMTAFRLKFLKKNGNGSILIANFEDIILHQPTNPLHTHTAGTLCTGTLED